MNESDSLDVEIGRRALLRAATVLAVVPVIGCSSDDSTSERADETTKDKATSTMDTPTSTTTTAARAMCCRASARAPA